MSASATSLYKEVLWTKRFSRSLEKEDDPPRRRLLGELRSLVRMSNEELISKNLVNITQGQVGEVAGDLGISLLKIRLSNSSRLIFYIRNEALVFVDYDWNHTSLDELQSMKKGELKSVLTSTEVIEPRLRSLILQSESELYFPSSDGGDRATYAEALGNEWVRFLDKPQNEICDLLFDALTGSDELPSIHFLVGGAGTGKTMVLLELAWRLINVAETTIDLRLPQGVRSYLAVSEKDYWHQGQKSGHVLIDDPEDIDVLRQAIADARATRKSLVATLDPTQWTGKKSRREFHALLEIYKPQVHELKLGYRQGGAVGEAALRIARNFFRNSSMWASAENIKYDLDISKRWESLCLEEVEFKDMAGNFSLIEVKENEHFVQSLKAELEKVIERETYRKWPKLLLGISDKQALPQGVKDLLKEYEERNSLKLHFYNFNQVSKVRGTEYESVFLFLKRDEFQSISVGRFSLNKIEWPRLTAPITFMTRAENRLAIFLK